MGLEAATFISQLVPSNPVGATDPKSQGDDHIRLIKSVLQATFPNITGAVTPTHTALNYIVTAGFQGPAGSAAAPPISFSGDPNSGLYNVGADDIALVTNGAIRLELTTTVATFTGVGTVWGPDGTVGAPCWSFFNDPNTGIIRVAADVGGLVAGGVEFLRWSSAQFGTLDGSVGAPAWSFTGDTNTGIYHPAADQLAISLGGAIQYLFTNASFQLAFDGSAGSPAYTFGNDTNTGFLRLGNDQLGFSEGGASFRIGYRTVPKRAGTFAIGECCSISAGITLNTTDMAAGNCFSIYNDSAASITITQGAGVTLRLGGTATTGSRTLAQRGLATIWCNSGTEAVISGSGVS